MQNSHSLLLSSLHYPGNRTQDLLLSGESGNPYSVCWVKKIICLKQRPALCQKTISWFPPGIPLGKISKSAIWFPGRVQVALKQNVRQKTSSSTSKSKTWKGWDILTSYQLSPLDLWRSWPPHCQGAHKVVFFGPSWKLTKVAFCVDFYRCFVSLLPPWSRGNSRRWRSKEVVWSGWQWYQHHLYKTTLFLALEP